MPVEIIRKHSFDFNVTIIIIFRSERVVCIRQTSVSTLCSLFAVCVSKRQ